jgi:hypothetical protein
MKVTVNKFYIHNRQENDPEISWNGIHWRTVSREELENVLKQLKNDQTACIIYSRENPDGNLSNRAQEIFNLIETTRLPIRLAKKQGSDGSGESEPNGEANYANCLLVTIAKSKGSIAVLESGKTVPDLERLSNNPNELPWIRGLPFDYGRLNANVVMYVIFHFLRNALEPFGNDRIAKVGLALRDGGLETVRFQLKRTETAEKGLRVEITRIT